jgi:adenine-specific DNA-methyltransferase
MKRLLSDKGSIYVHIGPQMNHLVRLVADEVFGIDHGLREIIWQRVSSRGHGEFYPATHDAILFYAKSSDPIWNQQYTPLDPEYIASKYRFADPDGRTYRKDNCLNQNRDRPNLTYDWNGHVRTWRWTKEKMQELHVTGRLIYTSSGIPEYKRYLDESEGVALQSVWTDLPPVNSQAAEDTGYDTQKPATLLERIILSSSVEGSVVADFFCGSGTTAAVAEKLGRRWITSDLGKVGIQVTRGRLVQQDAKPFLIENIGNYQREMIYLTGGRIGEMQRIILKLYGATPHPNYKDLGVRRAEDATAELVYVGYPDRPTTAKKVEELARLAESLDGEGYKRLVILAWDYDYSYDEAWDARIKSSKKPLKVEVQKKLIPPDVYDYLKKAKTEADIEKLADKIVFHEKPYLKLAKPAVGRKVDGKREVTIGIDRYVLFDLPVPEKDQEKLRELVKENFAVLIDYWAIDWTYDGTTFKSQWQAIRGNGKKATIVPTTVTEKLDAGMKYTIAVRVVDVFGNDAAGLVVVET